MGLHSRNHTVLRLKAGIIPILFAVWSWCVIPPNTEYKLPPVAEFVEVAHAEELPDYSTTTMRKLVLKTAEEHHLNIKQFDDTVKCESSYVYNAYNFSEDSAGIVQIHLPAHPDISIEKANDPYFSLNWMAKQWENGDEEMWTCFRP